MSESVMTKPGETQAECLDNLDFGVYTAINMSSAKLKKLDNNISLLLEQILEIEQMVRARYNIILTKCGKPNCRCATEGKKHSHARLSWSENGRPVNRAPPKEDVDWLIQVTGEYKQYKELRSRLVKLQSDFLDELDKRANQILEKTKKGKHYLNIDKV